MIAENRFYKSIHKNKHPAAKCKKAKCLVCSGKKVLDIPTRQQMVADSILKKFNNQQP